MKFFILLFILIVLTSSYANSTIFPTILRRDDSEELAEECIKEIENSEYYNKCMPIMTISNYKKACSDIESEKCKTFYNDPLKYFTVCNKFPEFNEIFQPLIFNDVIQGFKSKCLTDEKGDLCPYSLLLLTDTNGEYDGAYEAISDTCKSKKCTDTLIEIFKQVNIDQYAAYENLSFTTGSYSYKDLNAIKKLISVLEDDKCKSEHVTSNANYIKINDILLITLTLLMFLFIN
ncbi:hypothetical protein BCR32DRAFT_285620 [Anaeromyces robustus]|uniref:Uncharacterized protein n=1 Tax=Anaeromyces robustus TaxID=1754192 RepID=A0A1Y1WIQ7_9FUNG|nr:hypothetical protein BCR32DRAFT_285620 [Anaeromyces robustus]|eukprot:ORX73460.1 hypothetical protein BCR32DRAFT_285620 [Anaeromyces robustus]